MKKIKINWGKGILLGMGAFVLYITAMGVYMFAQSSDEYDKQYYEKGLAYDSVYNQERAVVLDKVQPKIILAQNDMHVAFVRPANGTVQFERLADPSLNRLIAFEAHTAGDVNIDVAKFKKGRWDLTFRWTNAGKKYTYQQRIDLP